MNPKQQQQRLIIGGIIVVAVVAVVALIALSGATSASGIDFSAIPHARTEDGGVVLGNPDAPITLVEFADFACSHCIEYKPEVDRFIKEQVATGQAKYEFRVFPTAGGQMTNYAGAVAYCAEELQPGAFWPTMENLFQMAQSARYNDQMGRAVAQQLGINYADLLECTTPSTRVNEDVALGRNLGVSGTPAVAVRYGDGDITRINYNGTTYDRGPVSYDILAALVAQAHA